MSEQADQRTIRDFFTENEAGKKLLARWENRVESMRRQLIEEKELSIIRQLQGSIQAYEKTIFHEDIMGGKD